MLSRLSKVQSLHLKTCEIGSITQIGDSKIINSLSRALAVQREAEIFYTNEGDYSLYPIFSEPIPLPPLEEKVLFQKEDFNPCIQVGSIKITGASTSSIVHIGNSEHVYLESRVKHIRQLFDEE
jgi:spore germination protein PE